VSGRSGDEHAFRADDGSADPRAAEALAAFASGSGTEHAALISLADSRLLVPVVAAPADGSAHQTSVMALPTLVGADGRRAVPAFTSLAALTRWRPGARPVPTEAAAVWQAAAADSCAVVIDVAGPVPLAIEGARLEALARGEAVPLPHQDPDVMRAVAAAVTAAVAAQPDGARAALGPGDAGSDLVIQLMLPAGCEGARAGARADDLAARLGAALMARLGGRLRRGITIAVHPARADPARPAPAAPADPAAADPATPDPARPATREPPA
jgi:SseB protein N-terminal domain